MNKCLIAVIIFTKVLAQTNAQDTTSEHKEGIIAEINVLFEKSHQAGERLDMSGMTENVSDALAAGFIDNGIYFDSFDEVMKGFKNGIIGLASQKILIAKKKVTVLSESAVLLTATGNYSAALEDGRTLNGRFSWTFIYARIDGAWKVVHTHMSNPR